jgi:hypothetical protein
MRGRISTSKAVAAFVPHCATAVHIRVADAPSIPHPTLNIPIYILRYDQKAFHPTEHKKAEGDAFRFFEIFEINLSLA